MDHTTDVIIDDVTNEDVHPTTTSIIAPTPTTPRGRGTVLATMILTLIVFTIIMIGALHIPLRELGMEAAQVRPTLDRGVDILCLALTRGTLVGIAITLPNETLVACQGHLGLI